MSDSIPLVDAALRLGRSYNATMRLVLTGRLVGQRNERRQWLVTSESLERFLKDQPPNNHEPQGRVTA